MVAINLDNIFARKVDYLLTRQKTAEVISGNIANADTPGFKAKGLDFGSHLQKAHKAQEVKLSSTHKSHITPDNGLNYNLAYRIPEQPDTGDGNTVDVNKERNLFLVNSLQYQYGLNSINGTIKGLKKAIIGGNS
jgi:flagellar basal-body rod protein FlgB